MKPYYQDNFGEIYLGNCLEIIPQLSKVDLTLTDPPYGNGTHYEDYSDSLENLKELISNFMPELFGISPLIAITPGNGNMYYYPKPSWTLCWYVGQNGVGRSPWGFSCWQPILVYGKDPYLQNNMGCRPDVIVHEFENQYSVDFHNLLKHPCPKPEKTWSKLISRLTTKTSVILDPFLGSGTTAVCAKKLGHRYIGIEMSEEYIDIAIKRLRQTVMIFDEPAAKNEQLELIKPEVAL